MNKQWFVLNENSSIDSIGECEDFEDADNKAPNAIWIFAPDTMEDIYNRLKIHFI